MHESPFLWFEHIPGYEGLTHAFRALLEPVNHGGLTWVGHTPLSILHVVHLFVVVLLLTILGAMSYAKTKEAHLAVVPEASFTVRTFMELFVERVYNMMADMMGREAAKYFLPLIGTCAFIIFFSNAMGLIPGLDPPTHTLNTTLAMGLVIFLATHIYGVKEHGLGYFKHFLGPVWWLAPLMLPIELISHFSRPLTLAVRLMANMTADHLVLGIFLSLGSMVYFGAIALPMYVLGCIVVFVQTLVFCLLSTVYISMAIAHEGH